MGRLTVYEPRGDYQLLLETVEPKGIGQLQLAFKQLKSKLEAEGIFQESRKQALRISLSALVCDVTCWCGIT